MKYCKYCNEILNNNENICRKCGKIQNKTINQNMSYTNINNNATCSKCGSMNIKVQKINIPTKEKAMIIFLWIILTIITLGIFLIFIPKIKEKHENKSCFVCQNCGNYWKYE